MDNSVARKLAMFEDLSFDEAKEVILELSRELTQNSEDIFYHISVTLPGLSENTLEKKVLTDIYREIAIANQAVTEEEKNAAIAHLTSQHDTLKRMLEQEKAERITEIAGLDATLSIL